MNIPDLEGLGWEVTSDVMARLLKEGDLLLEYQEQLIPRPTPEVLDELSRVSHYDCWVGLSEVGSAKWTAAAAPKWDRYYACLGDNDSMSVWSARRETIQRLIDNRFGWQNRVLPETIRWREVRPWKATYWKTLDAGWEADFQYEWCSPHDPYRTLEEESAIQEWREMNEWFTCAWDLPGWKWPTRRGRRSSGT